MQKLLQEQKELEKQIQDIKDARASLPSEVSAEELGHKSLELILERKIFLDVLRIVMNNANQMLLDVFKHCYHDPRDLHAVLYAITQQGGVVEEYADRVIVKLKMLDKRIYQEATKKLFMELDTRFSSPPLPYLHQPEKTITINIFKTNSLHSIQLNFIRNVFGVIYLQRLNEIGISHRTALSI